MVNEEIKGLSIPFRINRVTGSVVIQKNSAEKLKENLIHILLTGIGERVMNRNYGGGLRQLLHDPNNDALRSIVQHQIAKSIGRWEPRIVLQNVTVYQKNGELHASIEYMLRQTQEFQSLTVPLSGNI